MTPGKLLIAQRLVESARELRDIIGLMEEHKNDPAWRSVADDLARAADTAWWWATEIRAER